MDQLSPAINFTLQPLDPPVPFHAIKNADEGRRLHLHPFGEFGLRKRSFERQKPEHLALPIGDTGRRKFFIHRALIFVCSGHHPESDAVFEIVCKHEINSPYK